MWVKPLKKKLAETVLNGLILVVNESNSMPKEIWVDQGREFYNNFM